MIEKQNESLRFNTKSLQFQESSIYIENLRGMEAFYRPIHVLPSIINFQHLTSTSFSIPNALPTLQSLKQYQSKLIFHHKQSTCTQENFNQWNPNCKNVPLIFQYKSKGENMSNRKHNKEKFSNEKRVKCQQPQFLYDGCMYGFFYKMKFFLSLYISCV